MKKLIQFLVLLSMVLMYTSCLKEDHSIRVRNNLSEDLINVQVGSAHFASVSAGSTSQYESINTGNFVVSGSTSSGKTFNGSGTLSGKGKHKWSLNVNRSGTFTFSED